MARIRITVSMEIPEGADRDDCLAYVQDAIESWKGSYHPADPMFELDRSTVVSQYVTTHHNRRTIIRCSSED